ncbi:MAG: hypothetical protein KIS85_06615 [Anaerolineales bacterium]|nr:hypothetical protein [Anaerolineales bacterium]
MSDLYDQVQSDQDIFRRLAGKIPGFSGYVDRENRRAADKILRESIADGYEQIWKRVTEIQKDLANAGAFDLIDDMEEAAMKLRTFIDKVRTASYGNTGFFAAIKIKSPELQRLYEFDLALVDRADEITAAVDATRAALGTDDLAGAVRHLIDLGRDLVSTFESRNEVITAEEAVIAADDTESDAEGEASVGSLMDAEAAEDESAEADAE